MCQRIGSFRVGGHLPEERYGILSVGAVMGNVRENSVDSCSSDAAENGSVCSVFVGTNELMSSVQRLYLYCFKTSL